MLGLAGAIFVSSYKLHNRIFQGHITTRQTISLHGMHSNKNADFTQNSYPPHKHDGVKGSITVNMLIS